MKHYFLNRDFNKTIIFLFWLCSVVILFFIVHFEYSLHILLIILVPLVASMMLETKDFIYHASVLLVIFSLVMAYGFLNADHYPYLRDSEFLLALFLLLFFVFGLSLVYNQAIKKSYEKLQKANQEKEFLLKEVHHRVKNNLNIVASILGLERYESDIPQVHELIEKNRLRIESIAMAHEILYKSDNFANICFKEYIYLLSKHILENDTSINLKLDIIPLKLNIEDMIQFGIIINELITNSIKYAFHNNKGSITISLSEVDDTFTLIYQDNGCGMSKDANAGFGQSLIKMSVQQLKATLSIKNINGLQYSIFFKQKDKMSLK